MNNALARDLAYALDPVQWARDAIGITPDPWQEDVLRWSGKRMILNCSRQSGKSSTTAVLAAWAAIYQPGSLTLLVSPSLRQSVELFRKVTDHLDRLDAEPRRIEDNKTSLQYETGSRVVSLPSSQETIRGFSAVDLAVFDEDAWVPDALYRSIRPMLAVSNGRLILMSTPFGKRGHFFETWENGGPEWERIRITAHDCPRISPSFLDEERASLGDLWFRSEYLCEFLDDTTSMFPADLVRAAFSDAVQPLWADQGDELLSTDVAPLWAAESE